MRLADILFTHNVCLKNRHPQLDLRQARHRDALTKLANAHATDWLVKQFWNLERAESQPPGPAPPNADADQQRLVPSRQYRRISGE
jgi:hypothetical protein